MSDLAKQMTKNLDRWAKLSKTDKGHTKGFSGRPGGFSGTSIDPMWRIMRLTEEFGPVGDGWRTTKPEFDFHPCPDGQILVFCTVGLSIGDGEPVYGVGGDVAFKKFKNGNTLADDEACKKAFTDALMNAAKHLGMAADIYMGGFDADKYMAQGGADQARENGQANKTNGHGRRQTSGYQNKYVKPQRNDGPPPGFDDPPPCKPGDTLQHDPETGEILEGDHFGHLDDGGPLPAPKFKSAKELGLAIQNAPNLTELAILDKAYQDAAEHFKPKTKDTLFKAIQDRMRELQGAAA